MRRHRKSGRGKLIAFLAFAAAALAIFFLLPVRAPQEQGKSVELVPEGGFSGRKNIYDRRHRELAVSLQLTSVYARPLELREPEMIASQFADFLEQDEKELLRALGSERSFVWLARRLDAEKSARISGLETRGLYFFTEEQRFYPQRESGAHVLGFLGDEQGLAGIEYFYEQFLQGGWGRELNNLPRLPSSVDTQKGIHLVLTLDLPVQAFFEQELARLKRETGAAAAMALVMEPATGEIHAMVNLPAFDPNLFWKFSTAERRNRILVDPLFPGSLWNLFRLAAAVEGGQEIGKEDHETSPLLSARRVKRNQKSAELHEDWVELAPGIHASPSLALLSDLHPGAAELTGLAGRVGLTRDPDIDLPRGLENGESWERPDFENGLEMNTPTTALQLLAAFNHLIGPGELVRPHLLKALLNEEGGETPLLYGRQMPLINAAARQEVSGFFLSGASGSGPAAGMAESLLVHSAGSVSAGKEDAAASRCRQQNVLLGVIPGSSPLSFLLVLDDACIDPGLPSALRLLGGKFAGKLESMRQEAAGETAGPVGKTEEEIYRRWRELHQTHDRAAEKPTQREDRMADVRGLGLRQALQILQSSGLQVEISGSGRVVSQQPKPGVSLAGVREISLELRTDHE